MVTGSLSNTDQITGGSGLSVSNSSNYMMYDKVQRDKHERYRNLRQDRMRPGTAEYIELPSDMIREVEKKVGSALVGAKHDPLGEWYILQFRDGHAMRVTTRYVQDFFHGTPERVPLFGDFDRPEMLPHDDEQEASNQTDTRTDNMRKLFWERHNN